MLVAKCLEIIVLKRYGKRLRKIRRDKNNEPIGFEDVFETVEYEKGKPSDLILMIVIDGEKFSISISKQFREKFRQPRKHYSIFSEKRIYQIGSTMPAEINVESTGNSRHPYRVEDQAINAWYKKIN